MNLNCVKYFHRKEPAGRQQRMLNYIAKFTAELIFTAQASTQRYYVPLKCFVAVHLLKHFDCI